MYETVNLHVVLGKKRVMTCWDLDHRMDGTRTRFVTREFIGDETMFVVSAPSSTPSMGRVFDDLSFKKSYRTFTTDVTNPYLHVDEDEKQQAALENSISEFWRLRKQLYGPRRAGTRWVDFMAERIDEQRFDRCDAAPQLFANVELVGFIGVHME